MIGALVVVVVAAVSAAPTPPAPSAPSASTTATAPPDDPSEIWPPAPPAATPAPAPAPPTPPADPADLEAPKPVPVAPAPAPAPRTTPRPDARAAAAADAQQLDPLLVGLLQALVPCGTSIVGLPVALLVGAFIPGGFCLACLLPAASGYVATIVGDRFGSNRAPALWPVVASYVAAIAATIAAGGFYVAVSASSAGSDPTVAFVVAAGATAALGFAVAAVPVSYYLTSEPKHPGDDGSSTPGFFAPGHPASAQRY